MLANKETGVGYKSSSDKKITWKKLVKQKIKERIKKDCEEIDKTISRTIKDEKW